MIRTIMITLLILFIPGNVLSKDYMIELFEEHYKEKMITGGGQSKIYHSWQVRSEFGNKVLFLIGDDIGYRSWLRKYRNHHHLFIVKIPDAGEEKFKYDIAIPINVQQIHPVFEKKWKCIGCRFGPPPEKPITLPQ